MRVKHYCRLTFSFTNDNLSLYLQYRYSFRITYTYKLVNKLVNKKYLILVTAWSDSIYKANVLSFAHDNPRFASFSVTFLNFKSGIVNVKARLHLRFIQKLDFCTSLNYHWLALYPLKLRDHRLSFEHARNLAATSRRFSIATTTAGLFTRTIWVAR